MSDERLLKVLEGTPYALLYPFLAEASEEERSKCLLHFFEEFVVPSVQRGLEPFSKEKVLSDLFPVVIGLLGGNQFGDVHITAFRPCAHTQAGVLLAILEQLESFGDLPLSSIPVGATEVLIFAWATSDLLHSRIWDFLVRRISTLGSASDVSKGDQFVLDSILSSIRKYDHLSDDKKISSAYLKLYFLEESLPALQLTILPFINLLRIGWVRKLGFLGTAYLMFCPRPYGQDMAKFLEPFR